MLAAANLIFCYLKLMTVNVSSKIMTVNVSSKIMTVNVSFSAHIMQSVTVLVLVLMWCTQTVHAQEGQ